MPAALPMVETLFMLLQHVVGAKGRTDCYFSLGLGTEAEAKDSKLELGCSTDPERKVGWNITAESRLVDRACEGDPWVSLGKSLVLEALETTQSWTRVARIPPFLLWQRRFKELGRSSQNIKRAPIAWNSKNGPLTDAELRLKSEAQCLMPRRLRER